MSLEPSSLRTLPPNLGIGRHGAVLPTVLRVRVRLRHQITSRTGRPHERGNPLEMRGCFTPSHGRQGALKERRGPFGDPFCVKRPVSKGRMALPTPFETKRTKAPSGALGRIRHLNVAVQAVSKEAVSTKSGKKAGDRAPASPLNRHPVRALLQGERLPGVRKLLAFIACRSCQPGDGGAENSRLKWSSFVGADHRRTNGHSGWMKDGGGIKASTCCRPIHCPAAIHLNGAELRTEVGSGATLLDIGCSRLIAKGAATLGLS